MGLLLSTSTTRAEPETQAPQSQSSFFIALKAAKVRRRVLGKHGRDVLAPRNKAAAMERAKGLEQTIRAEGKGLREIAAVLNERGIATPRSGKWHPTSVQRLLTRLMSGREEAHGHG